MNKVYLETYGCSNNQAESEMMASLVEELESFQLIEEIDQADFVVLNSCYVKQATENKIKYRIKQLYDQYGENLIVAGCMPEIDKRTLEDIAPQASIVSTNYLDKINLALSRLDQGERVDFSGDRDQSLVKVEKDQRRRNPVVSILPISSGCLGNCSFCCVKTAKGNLKSYTPDKIIKEAEKSIEDGCKELWITGQDTGCYGFDREKEGNLPKLIERISQLEGEFKIRIGMMNPESPLKIKQELIEAFGSKKVYKFLHLPIQSGSNNVLEDMNRRYTVKEFKEFVDDFRQRLPKLTLATDIIAGYPTESPQDFDKSINFLREIEPDITHVSRYNSRPTATSNRLDNLDSKEVKKRSKRVSRISDKITAERNQSWVGWKGKVLVSERTEENSYKARNFSYKPIVVDKKEDEQDILGEFVRVEVTQNKKYYLKGDRIDSGV